MGNQKGMQSIAARHPEALQASAERRRARAGRWTLEGPKGLTHGPACRGTGHEWQRMGRSAARVGVIHTERLCASSRLGQLWPSYRCIHFLMHGTGACRHVLASHGHGMLTACCKPLIAYLVVLLEVLVLLLLLRLLLLLLPLGLILLV